MESSREGAPFFGQYRRRMVALVAVAALPAAAALAGAGTAAAEPAAESPSPYSAPAPQNEADPFAPLLMTVPGVLLAVQSMIPQPLPGVPVDPRMYDSAAVADATEGSAPAADSGPAQGDSTPAVDSVPAQDRSIPGVDSVPAQDGSAPAVDSVPAQADSGAPVFVGRNSSSGMRAIPDGSELAPVDPTRLHMPDPATAAPVAPIAPPAGKLRAGDTQVDIPAWLPPEQAAQANGAAARTEAELARTLDSAGFAPSRSDRIAAQALGTGAVGAAVGAGVVSPLTVAAAMMGGFIGAMAGTPFAPAGWVFGPVAGATAAATLVTVPAMAVGTAVGAVVGGVNGYLAPPVGGPAQS
ncbi:hypothetical protein [Nocardia arthritidis]|uniref:DUF456 family protein n=1 Tax=Nocardia arthritidis TaxID=228602 RepID=A0A6G9YK30_9NOCA|nr:hypothetical protein [Nocardia arthritidis]QIS13293.1 hypothetical protein F5544_27195 [Nocardia arthritidis]